MNFPTGEVKKSELMKQSRKIQSKEADFNDNVELFKVNPDAFRKLKFKCVMESEAVTPKSDALMKAMNLEEYDRAIANPLIAQSPENMKAVTRDLLFGSYDRTKDDPDVYLGKSGPAANGGMMGAQPQSGTQQQIAQASQGNLQSPTPPPPQQPQNRASLLAGIQPASTAQIAKAHA